MELITQIRDFINKPFIEFSIFEIGLTEIFLAIALLFLGLGFFDRK